jgi:hypothetical protein
MSLTKTGEEKTMNLTNSMIAAAVGGILMGVAGCGGASEPAKSPTDGTTVTPAAAATGAATPAKHSCKGQNDCKGQGGCKTEKHSCKGQNDCKGQGGCKG